jgi:hypothetical protein
MPKELPMQTMRMGTVCPSMAWREEFDMNGTDSSAGKARVAKEDFRNTRRFMRKRKENREPSG